MNLLPPFSLLMLCLLDHFLQGRSAADGEQLPWRQRLHFNWLRLITAGRSAHPVWCAVTEACELTALLWSAGLLPWTPAISQSPNAAARIWQVAGLLCLAELAAGARSALQREERDVDRLPLLLFLLLAVWQVLWLRGTGVAQESAAVPWFAGLALPWVFCGLVFPTCAGEADAARLKGPAGFARRFRNWVWVAWWVAWVGTGSEALGMLGGFVPLCQTGLLLGVCRMWGRRIGFAAHWPRGWELPWVWGLSASVMLSVLGQKLGRGELMIHGLGQWAFIAAAGLHWQARESSPVQKRKNRQGVQPGGFAERVGDSR